MRYCWSKPGERRDDREIDALARALAPSAERLLEAEAMGEAFASTTVAAWGGSSEAAPLPVALGRAAVEHGVPIEPTVLLYLQAFAAMLIGAGVSPGSDRADGRPTHSRRLGADLRRCRRRGAHVGHRRHRRVRIPRRHRVDAPRDPRGKAVSLMTPASATPASANPESAADRSKAKSPHGPLRVGVGGPVGAGKTTLTDRLCKAMRDAHSLAVITNDIYTREDAEALMRSQALPSDRVVGVETGGCPHTAIREDASINLAAVADLRARHPDLDLILIESGGDNLAATFSPELADLTIYVIDVAAGEEIPRKGGPGITRSDLLVVNKTDLAPHVGVSLDVMRRDAARMRGERPFLFTNLRRGDGVDDIVAFLTRAGGLDGEG